MDYVPQLVFDTVAADNRCCCCSLYFECYSCCPKAGSEIVLERY